jgi:hypothetical protein
MRYLDANKRDPKPFIWAKTADEILASIARFYGAGTNSPPEEFVCLPRDLEAVGRPTIPDDAEENSLQVGQSAPVNLEIPTRRNARPTG